MMKIPKEMPRIARPIVEVKKPRCTRICKTLLPGLGVYCLATPSTREDGVAGVAELDIPQPGRLSNCLENFRRALCPRYSEKNECPCGTSTHPRVRNSPAKFSPRNCWKPP